jgi:hypothetical protein
MRFSTFPALSANEFHDVLSEAFVEPAPDFDESWRSRYDGFDWDSRGFAGWEGFIHHQIVDLREMAEQGILADEWRYFGVESPRGSHWVNFDPRGFLECAVQGCFGGWQPGDDTGRILVPGEVAVMGDDGKLTACDPRDVPSPVLPIPRVSWDDFRTFLECGQWYE